MINTIIFDMDGVIIDSEPVHLKIGQKIFRDLGLNISREEHLEYVGRSDIWERIKEKYDLDYENEELRERSQNCYLSYLQTSCEEGPIEGVAELIKELYMNSLTLVLASSSMMKNINIVLDKFGLTEYFPYRISGADLETSKPHPEIFQKAAKLAETHPRHCLVIEDSQNGVKAAKAAGMWCAGYQNPNSGQQNLEAADWTIAHFNEFDLKKFNSNAGRF